jgi:hypothetical protein
VTLLLGGAAVVAAVRAAVALAEARVRAGDWPLWRLGPWVTVLIVHDLAVGLAGYGLFAVLPPALLPGGGAPAGAGAPAGIGGPLLSGVAGTLAGLAVAGRLLRRRRGVPLRSIGAAISNPGSLAREPLPTARERLLARIERHAERASARWIGAQLDACRRQSAASDDQLLSAVSVPVRFRLRETVGAGRTEVALLLLQAQSVLNDASPALERLLTLLHLVHDRSGRRGVRDVLGQARRGAGAARVPGPGLPGDPRLSYR